MPLEIRPMEIQLTDPKIQQMVYKKVHYERLTP